MKKLLVSSVAVLAIVAASTGIAAAADVTEPEALPYDWTGFYIGADVGYGAADFSGGHELEQDEADDPPELAKDLDLNGFVGGGHAGFNYQVSPMFVVGIEGDATFMNWDDEILQVNGSETEGVSGNVDMLASLRARLGIAKDRLLIYGTGGVALADAEFSAFEIGDFKESLDFDNVGGVVGAGVEYAATDNVSVRAEGLYYIFNDKKGLDKSDSGDYGKFNDAFVIRIGASWYLGR